MTATATGTATAAATATATGARRIGGPAATATGVLVLLAVLAAAVLASLALGARPIPLPDVVTALVAPGGDDASVVVRELRVPRTAVAVLAGAALAVAGALMQGLVRNPLADPGILGINAGAALALVVAVSTLGVTSLTGGAVFAVAGAAGAGVAVYVLAGAGTAAVTPARLTLAGVAVTAMLASLTTAVVLGDRGTLETYRFWVVGSLSGRDADTAAQLAPVVAVGLAVALAVARHLDTLALGDEAATALGTPVGRVRAAAGLAVVLLAGAATAAAGPLVFVGLVAAHAVRAWTGPGHRRLVPAAAAAGAVVVLVADTAGRLLLPPGEVPVGIVLAALGGPVFVALVRHTRLGRL